MLGDVHIDNIINKNFNYLSIMCLQIDSLLFNFYIIKFVLYKGSLKKRKNTSILFILKRGEGNTNKNKNWPFDGFLCQERWYLWVPI